MIFEDIDAPVTLLLHHPHFFDATYWEGWSQRTRCNIVAVDAPHHGDNDRDQSFRDFAVSSVDAARAVTSTPLIVAGVSQGGVIAQESADQDGVIGVIGISTTRDSAPPDEIESMNRLLTVWGEAGPGDELAAMIATGSTNGVEPSASVTRDTIAAFPLHRLERSIPVLLGRRGGQQLSVPTRFIHGTTDQTYSHNALVEHGVDLKTIDGGSHSVIMQSPDEVAGIITAFAEELVGTSL